ncbi:MAG: presenilin family intramembrane aspartyl protease [Candidatus Micrarchaeota archaeon]|nr:presenilin family intramembrane aspartyl protease [Candidatus Micrarchaeota archaeon]
MKTYTQVTLMFAITQLLGIYSGAVMLAAALAVPELREMTILPQVGDPNEPATALTSAFILIGYILLGAAMVLVAARLFKGMLFFQLLEFAVISSASSVVFFSAAYSLLGMDFVSAVLAGIIFGLALALAKLAKVEAKNAAAVISSAGVGAIFGFSVLASFGPALGFLAMSAFVVLLSLYDYIAVFKTKHMIEMARELSGRQLSFAISAKSLPPRKEGEKTEQYVERAMREGERLDLGTGDLSVPAMISVSAYSLGANGLVYALAVAAGSTVALYILLRFVSKQKVFLPALPPICLGGMLALLAVKLAGL